MMKSVVSCLVVLFISANLLAQPIRLATYQYANNDRKGNLSELGRHIQSELKREVVVRSYPTVQAFMEGIRNNEVDIALINTFGYLLLETSGKPFPMKAVAAWVVPEGTADIYKTAFLVKDKGPVLNWRDLGSHSEKLRLALVAKGSTSGNLVPRLALTQLGIQEAEHSFDTVLYAGNHQAAVEFLLDGKADIAAMGHDAYLKLVAGKPAADGLLRQIYLSPEIPLGPALVNVNLSLETRLLIENILLNLHSNAPSAMQGLRDGWTEARKATHFERIEAGHYEPFLRRFGQSSAVAAILQQFAN